MASGPAGRRTQAVRCRWRGHGPGRQQRRAGQRARTILRANEARNVLSRYSAVSIYDCNMLLYVYAGSTLGLRHHEFTCNNHNTRTCRIPGYRPSDIISLSPLSAAADLSPPDHLRSPRRRISGFDLRISRRRPSSSSGYQLMGGTRRTSHGVAFELHCCCLAASLAPPAATAAAWKHPKKCASPGSAGEA